MSDNLLCLFKNLLDSASILASTSAEASMPVSYLQNALRAAVWRSTSSANQNIDITLDASGKSYSHIALVDHNLSTGASILVTGWSDALGGASQVFSVTLSPFSYASSFGTDLLDGGGYDGGIDSGYLLPALVIDTTVVTTARFIRITLSGSNQSYYQMGRLVVANAWQPAENMTWGWTLGLNDNSKYIKSGYGQEYGDTLPANTVVDLQLDFLGQLDQDEMALQRLRLGFNTPFILQLRPNGNAEKLYMSYYGKCKALPMSPNRAGNSTLKWRFEESL